MDCKGSCQCKSVPLLDLFSNDCELVRDFMNFKLKFLIKWKLEKEQIIGLIEYLESNRVVVLIIYEKLHNYPK